jgi:transcription initiation factor TFIID subunit 2
VVLWPHGFAPLPTDSSPTAIHNVTVNAYPTEFTHNDPLTNIHLSSEDPKDCHRRPELKRNVYSAFQETDEGELSILIPREVPLKASGHHSSDTYFGKYIISSTVPKLTRLVGTPEPHTPGASFQPSGGQEFLPIIVRIDYSLRNPVDGFQFVVPTDSYPYVRIRVLS